MLETLMAHEARYFQFAGTLEERPYGWFLQSAELPDYYDANHALHLRDDGRGAEAVAREVIAYYRALDRRPVADIDAAAEEQGIGRALRQLGVTPVIGTMLLMRYTNPTAPNTAPNSVVVRRLTEGEDIRAWLEVVMSDHADAPPEERALWQAVAEREANSPDCRLYLAYLEGQAVGACDLFVADGWARVESVVTHPNWRRKGVATALVAQVVAASLAEGVAETYLYTERDGAGERVYRRLGFETWAVNPLRRHMANR